MKKNVVTIGLTLAYFVSGAQNTTVDTLSTLELQEVFVQSTRAGDKTPTAYTNVKKDKLESVNLGQDLPMLLRMTPSLVTTSDAGAGVGYTGMRIRGSDASRINVTVNGIPLNDSESQGVYWVNMPDFASTVNSIQIQRGVGTSTNGAGAFGATVNMETSAPSKEGYGMINNSIGSFGTRKHTVMINSGLIDDKWAFEGRLSKIKSDGYIDRAWSDLQSYYLSGGYYGKKTTIKALAFGGLEETYQSWYGTPEAKLTGDTQMMDDLLYFGGEYGTQEQVDNLNNSDSRTFNYYTYDNEIDHYQQDHYQLHFNHQIDDVWSFGISGHYTYGRGYYEQYRNDDELADYDLPNVVIGSSTVTNSDIIRRRWLDNDFSGFTYSVNYDLSNLKVVLGGGYNYYDGDHFGEIIWAEFASSSNIKDRYYDNVGTKNDFNSYLKVNYQLNEGFNLFGDAQVRVIRYSTIGIDSDLRAINIGDDYHFFNPKVGATYQLDEKATIYGSYAIGNREPVRNDFIDSPIMPKHETLYDLEIGYKRTTGQYFVGVNLYNMQYKNQLVLTGELNDVGNSVRTNVDDSYRRGVELEGNIILAKGLSWGANITVSENKIEKFNEVVYDYGLVWDQYNEVENNYKDTDISFSPNIIASSLFSFEPIEELTIGLQSKYVGKQFLDNISNIDRIIPSYFINDLNIGYTFKTDIVKEIGFQLLINNIMNVQYESNGYTWGYMAEGRHYQQNNYFPQAGINFLLAANLKF